MPLHRLSALAGVALFTASMGGIELWHRSRFDSELLLLEGNLKRADGQELAFCHSRFDRLGDEERPGHPQFWEDAFEAV